MSQSTRSQSTSGSGACGEAANCGKCAKILRENKDQAVACDVCNRWYHLECTDLTKSDIKTVSKPSVKWHCHSCCDVLGSFDHRLSSLEKRLDEQFTSQSKHIESFKQSWADVALKLDSNKSFFEKQVTTIKTDIKTNIEKEKSREFRSKNVILFGIKEDENTKFDDMVDEVQSILGKCHLPPIEQPRENVYRLGSRSPDKNRPIRLRLSSESQKWDYLRRINQNRIPGVFARLDLDRDEQEQDFRLRKELKEKRREDPGSHYKIVKGTIRKMGNP